MKQIIKQIVFVFLLLTILSIETNAQIKQIKTNEEIVSWTTDYMDNAVRFDHFSGVVLIARDGKPIFSKAYGMANYELDEPNNIDTKFRIGSLSKQFTATAIMLLQEQGKL